MTILEAFDVARRLGVTPSALHVLMVLIDDSPLMAGEIARRVGVKSSGITGIIDRLEQGDWVKRSHHTSDRRKIYVSPTERAFNLFTLTLEASTL